MSRVVAKPNQLDLDSPGRRDYWLALEHDSIWGDHLIPLEGELRRVDNRDVDAGGEALALARREGEELARCLARDDDLRRLEVAVRVRLPAPVTRHRHEGKDRERDLATRCAMWGTCGRPQPAVRSPQ